MLINMIPDYSQDQAIQNTLTVAFLLLKSQDECARFLRDLCTPGEIKAMTERLLVADLLRDGELSYREIHNQTKVSIATITRVARFLFQENYGGYQLMLPRLKEQAISDKEAEPVNFLYRALLLLKDQDECLRFLRDLCTPGEIKAMGERLLVARLLKESNFSYREIHGKTKVSIATITRVARFLFQENYGGYQLMLPRLEQEDKVVAFA